MDQEPITRHFLVEGRVQGVGFRRFVCQTAESLGLFGWTRNLADGRVEVLARGQAAALSRLEGELKVGPPHSKVNSVVTRSVGAQEFGEFVIEKDGEEPWQKK